jgi:hypothetical protein
MIEREGIGTAETRRRREEREEGGAWCLCGDFIPLKTEAAKIGT